MGAKRLVSWVVSDEFWKRVEPLIPATQRDTDKEYKRREGVTQGDIWEHQRHPPTLSRLGESRFFPQALESGLAEYDELKCIAWEWQSIDGTMTKAPLAQESVGRNPTDWGKNGEET